MVNPASIAKMGLIYPEMLNDRYHIMTKSLMLGRFTLHIVILPTHSSQSRSLCSLETLIVLTGTVFLSPGPFHTSGITGLQHTINMDGRDEFTEDSECCSNNSQEVQEQDSISGTGWRDWTGEDWMGSVGHPRTEGC